MKPAREIERTTAPSFPSSSYRTNAPAANVSNKRGATISLPMDFLRPPNYAPPTSSFSGLSTSNDYLTLFSDPAFLAEMEKEFGPDFEAVIREHMQAEALRNTANNSSYNAPQHSQYQIADLTVANQQTPQSVPSPPAQQQPTKPMEGFGGGDSGPPPSSKSSGPSISERFQGILNKFMAPSVKENSKEESHESKGLLSSNYDEMSEEEDEFVNSSNIDGGGMEMKSTKSNGGHSGPEEDLVEDTDSLLRK